MLTDTTPVQDKLASIFGLHRTLPNADVGNTPNPPQRHADQRKHKEDQLIQETLRLGVAAARPPGRRLGGAGLDCEGKRIEDCADLDDLVVLECQERGALELDQITGGGQLGAGRRCACR